MDKLIQTLVADYNEGLVTWHEIQDQVAAYVIEHDGHGLVMDKDIIHKRLMRENKILQEIEKRIGGN